MNDNTGFLKYRLLHLNELKAELETLDQAQYPNEVKEIKSLIASGGYQYPIDEKKGQRPFLITLLVIIGVLGGVLSIPLISSYQAQQLGYWYQTFLTVGIISTLICHIGFWLMRKWSIYLYIGLIILAQLILVQKGLWLPQSLIEPSIVMVVVLSYLPRMK